MNVVQRSRRRLANLMAQQPAPVGWFRVLRNDAGTGPTRVDIYDEIGGGGFFNERVSAIDFVAQLAAITGDLVVHINSPGGDVFDGLAIYNSLAQRPGNVTTVVDGLAASAASFIAMAGKTRTVCPGAMFMIHEAAGLCMGNAADMRELAELLDKVSDNIAGIYAERSGRAEGWRDAMRRESWYTADEAVAAGLAHRLAERPEASALAAAARFDLSAYLHPPRLGNADTPASTRHGPYTGTHTHPHGAMGAQGDDGTHEHSHTHDGDGDHAHSHAASAHTHTHVHNATESAGHGAYTGTHTHAHNSHDGPDSDGDGFHAHEHTHAGEDHHMHDHDGMDGATWAARRAAAIAALIAAGFNPDAVHEVFNASVDESQWDGPHAMSLAAKSEDPAATYKQICAGRRAGDPSKQDSWALPYKYPGKPPNRAGVKNALARLPQTQGLTNEAEAKALLQRLMKQINPDYESDDSAALPGWLTAHHDTAPLPAWLNAPEEATA